MSFHWSVLLPRDPERGLGTRVAELRGVSLTPHETAENLHDTCTRIHVAAEALAAAAAARKAFDRVEQLRAELTQLVTLHVATADQLLSTLPRRRLLHDHRRLTQLLRAVELASADRDLGAVAASVRRLDRFVCDHADREQALFDGS